MGLDGSAGSALALRWAAARTNRFGPIQPVASWQYPWWSLTPLAPGVATLPPPSVDFHAEARQVIDQMLAQVSPVCHLEPLTVHGPAGQSLVAAAEGASLLVVGSRGHSAVASGVLGSVSLYCVNHATAPVVVVSPDSTPQDRFQRVVVGLDGSDSSVNALTWAVANTPAEAEIEVIYSWRLGDTVTVERSASSSPAKLPQITMPLATWNGMMTSSM